MADTTTDTTEMIGVKSKGKGSLGKRRGIEVKDGESIYEVDRVILPEMLQLDALLKEQLSGLFSKGVLEGMQSIRLADIIERKLAQLFLRRRGVSKADFVTNPMIISYFGTCDYNRLGFLYDMLEEMDSSESLGSESLEGLKEREPFSPVEFSRFVNTDAEHIQKFIAGVYEREFASLLFLHALETGGEFPLSSILWEYGTGLLELIPYITKERLAMLEEVLDQKVSVESYRFAFSGAVRLLRRHAFIFNGIWKGCDRLDLILPHVTTEEPLTQKLLSLMLSIGLKNTIAELKLTVTGRPSIRGVGKYVRDIRRGSIKKLLYGDPYKYPSCIRIVSKDNLFLTVLGFGRLDALARDWRRISYELGADLFRTKGELSPETAFRLSTEDFRNALAQRKFGKNYTNLKSDERKIVYRLITALTQKFQNTIAQHQLIEYMRSGRWIKVDNLGYRLPQSKTGEAMEIVEQESLPQGEVGDQLQDSITIPFCIEGEIFRLLIANGTLFQTETINGFPRFGFTKYMDGNVVRLLPERILEFTSVKTDPSLFSGIPRRSTVRQIRSLQERIFKMVFRTDGIGHPSNWIEGEFMPERTVLEYGNATHSALKRMLHRVKEHVPVGFDLFKAYSTKLFNFSWTNALGTGGTLRKVVQTSNVTDRVPVVFPSGLHWVKIRRQNSRTPSERNQVLFINRCNHSFRIRSVTQFSRLVCTNAELKERGFKRGIRDPKRLKELFMGMDRKKKILRFASFGMGHQSRKTSKESGGGMPSPLEFSTVDPLTGTLLPQNLITLVRVLDEEEDISYFMFRPPSRYSKQLVQNLPMDTHRARNMLNAFYSQKERIWALAPHFKEVTTYLTENTVADLEKRHQMPAHMAMLKELELFAAGKRDLVQMQFKKMFENLKIAYIFGGPDFLADPLPDKFTIGDLRLTYGQYITTPDAIGYRSTNFKFGNQVEVFESPKTYARHGTAYLEALLRRIRQRLTLDAELFRQNLKAWLNAPVYTYRNSRKQKIVIPFNKVMDRSTIGELALRQLAPGHTILYGMDGRRKIIRTTNFAFENYVVTPIFLDYTLLDGNALEKILETYDIQSIDETGYLRTIPQLLDQAIADIRRKGWGNALKLATDPRSILSPYIRLMTIVVNA